MTEDDAWRLEVGREPGGTHLRVSGDLDLETAPQLLTAIEPYLATGADPLVIDLSRLAFIDSSGLSALIRINHRMTAAERAFTIIAPVPSVAKAFEITGLDRVLPLRPAS